MRGLLRVSERDMDCTVEPGITWEELNERLREKQLFFPCDPGPGASIGGMVGTRCSGCGVARTAPPPPPPLVAATLRRPCVRPNAVRYGTMRDNVLSLEAVLPQPGAPVVRTGQRARKSSAGYDLTRLFVGSEGTLGIVTKVTLKLQRIPTATAVAVSSFPTVQDACEAVIDLMQQGVQVAKVELLDEVMMRAVNAYSGTSYPEVPTLFLEFSGDDGTTVGRVAERARHILAEHRSGVGCGLGTAFVLATSQTEKARLWQARKDALWASHMLRRDWCAAAAWHGANALWTPLMRR